MARRSSVSGLVINSLGWTGTANPVTAGNEEIHAEIARSNVSLMKNGLMAKRLKIKGDLANPYPHGHQGVNGRRMKDLYMVDECQEVEEAE